MTEPANLLHPNLKPTPQLAYILGVLKGDGGVYCYKRKPSIGNLYEIHLGTRTKKFNLSFEQALISIGLNPSTFFKKANKAWTTTAKSKVFYNWYHSLSLTDIKDFLSSKELKKEFIRGFYESEGCTHWREERGKYEISMCNTDKDLILMIRDLLKSLGFSFYLRDENKNRKKKIWRLGNASREEAYDFLKTIDPCIKFAEKKPREKMKGGLKKYWSDDELSKLHRFYNKIPIGKLKEMLPERTIQGIWSQAYLRNLTKKHHSGSEER